MKYIKTTQKAQITSMRVGFEKNSLRTQLEVKYLHILHRGNGPRITASETCSTIKIVDSYQCGIEEMPSNLVFGAFGRRKLIQAHFGFLKCKHSIGQEVIHRFLINPESYSEQRMAFPREANTIRRSVINRESLSAIYYR